MAIFTERDREIIRLLRAGNNVSGVADKLGVSVSSVSKSISKIKLKTYEIQDGLEFLLNNGFVKIEENKLSFIHRDPKDLQIK